MVTKHALIKVMFGNNEESSWTKDSFRNLEHQQCSWIEKLVPFSKNQFLSFTIKVFVLSNVLVILHAEYN